MGESWFIAVGKYEDGNVLASENAIGGSAGRQHCGWNFSWDECRGS